MMNNTNEMYLGCPVQHARQFLAGKWKMGVLWNLRNKVLRFSEIKNLLSGISDKTLMQELDFFVQKNMIKRNVYKFPFPKTEYALTTTGQSLIPVINSIVEWGYTHLQDEKFTKEMNLTPLSVIEDIESSLPETEF